MASKKVDYISYFKKGYVEMRASMREPQVPHKS